MSNFAERLVARSSGLAELPGTAVLLARPASRFEGPLVAGGAAVGLEQESVQVAGRAVRAERPVFRQDAPSMPGLVMNLEQPGALRPADMPGAPPRPDDVEPRPGLPVREVVNDVEPRTEHHDTVEQRNFFYREQQEAATAAAAPTRTRKPGDMVDFGATPDILPPVAIRELVAREEKSASLPAYRNLPPPLRNATAVNREAERQAEVAPAISIGKIEVQFVQPPANLPPARAAPQQTRGFDAYARARRGEPR